MLASGHPVMGLWIVSCALLAILYWALRERIHRGLRGRWHWWILIGIAVCAAASLLLTIDVSYKLGVKSTQPFLDECDYEPPKVDRLTVPNKYKNATYGVAILFPLAPLNRPLVEYTVEVVEPSTAQIVHVADRTNGNVERSGVPGRLVKMTVHNPSGNGMLIPPGLNIYLDGRADIVVKPNWCECKSLPAIHVP